MSPNQELHQRTVEVLTTLVDVLDCDDLALLCYHAGVSVTELMPVTGHAASGDTESLAAFIERITS